jgi:hypothetical protein
MHKPVKFILLIEGETMNQETLNFVLSVNPAAPPPPPPNPLVVVDGNGAPLADGAQVTLSPETVGVADPGQKLFTVSGGTAPYNFSVASGNLPAGTSLNATTNPDGSETVTLSGTPTAAGPVSFALLVTDSAAASTTVAAATRKVA